MMKSRTIYQLLPTLLFLLVAGCSKPEIQPLILNDLPWSDGEQSLFVVTDINGDYAGTATFTLNKGAATIDDDAWTLRRDVTTQGDQEVVIIEMAAKGLRPHLSTLVRITGAARQQVKTTYDSGQIDMELTTARDVTTYERRNIPSDARDQRSLLLLARALPLAAGYATELNSYLPVADLFERTSIVVDRQEMVDVPAGSFQSWQLTVQASERKSQVWIAVDAPHQLLKFIDGRNGGTFELRDYQATGQP